MSEPHDLSGWRSWLMAAGVVLAGYALFVILGWASAHGPMERYHLLIDQPVAGWLLPVGVTAGLLGGAATWIAWRTAPPLDEPDFTEPDKWVIPVIHGTLVVSVLLGLATAAVAASDSDERGGMLGVPPLLGAAGYWCWRRLRRDGAL